MGKRPREKIPVLFSHRFSQNWKNLYVIPNSCISSIQKKKYLLLVFTGVAAQNVGGRTIHSFLKIRFHGGNYETLIHINDKDESDLKQIEAILIDEISMVNADLFTFLSNTFARIYNNNLIFGGVPVLVIGDLA